MALVDVGGLRYLHLADRTQLKQIAVEVIFALAAGEPGRARTSLGLMPELGELGVTDAVLGATELAPVPWTTAPGEARRTRVGILNSAGVQEGLVHELRSRGAEVVKLAPSEVAAASPRDLPGAIVTDVVDGSPERQRQLFDRFAGTDTLVVNPYTVSRNQKDVMAERWQEAGVEAPETITRLGTREAVVDAYRTLGPEVVLKSPRGAHGRFVEEARDEDAAIASFDHLPLGPRGVLMQRKIEIGGSDVRVHFSRDWLTGKLLPVGAVERRNLGTGFKTNLSGEDAAGAVRPIYDLTGGDPALPPEAIETARRAGDAMGYDAFAADVAIDQATGRPSMFEVDIASMVLDRHMPLPRAHSVYGRLADLLLHGDAATVDTMRGATV